MSGAFTQRERDMLRRLTSVKILTDSVLQRERKNILGLPISEGINGPVAAGDSAQGQARFNEQANIRMLLRPSCSA